MNGILNEWDFADRPQFVSVLQIRDKVVYSITSSNNSLCEIYKTASEEYSP